MSDDIVTRLEALASNYKTTEFEFMYADYETVCEASAEIERLRADIEERAKLMSKIVELLLPFSMLMNKNEQELLIKAVRGE